MTIDPSILDALSSLSTAASAAAPLARQPRSTITTLQAQAAEAIDKIVSALASIEADFKKIVAPVTIIRSPRVPVNITVDSADITSDDTSITADSEVGAPMFSVDTTSPTVDTTAFTSDQMLDDSLIETTIPGIALYEDVTKLTLIASFLASVLTNITDQLIVVSVRALVSRAAANIGNAGR